MPDEFFDLEGRAVHEREASANSIRRGTAGSHARNVETYEEYTQDHEYTHDSGLIVLPLASRTPGHRTIRLHGGMGMRIVKWRAARSGKPPLAPKPQDTAGDTFLSSSVTAGLPIPQVQSGNYLFRMSGTYTYVQDDPRIVGVNALPTGVHPYSMQPMDAIGAAYIGPAIAQFDVPGTVSEFDALVEAADAAIRKGRGTEFSWPMTVFPASFTEILIQG